MSPTVRIQKQRDRTRRRRSRRISRLTRRGGFLLLFGVLALGSSYWLGRSELLYLGSFCALLPLVALAYVRFRRMHFAVTRSFSPSVVSVGHPTVVEVEITNLSQSASMEANWRDSWPWQPFSTIPARLPALLGRGPRPTKRGNSIRVRYSIQPPSRGVYQVGPMLVDFSDPFGLAEGAFTTGPTAELIVTPSVTALADGVVSIAAADGRTRINQRRAFGGEDDLMTREYRRGDALRRVHWRASAHHGELMVRQEEQRSHAEARLLLDTRRTNYPDALAHGAPEAVESESFEWAIALTASLGVHLQRSGFTVQIIETGHRQVASLDRPEEFLESLASVALSDAGGAGDISLLRGVQRPDRSQGSVFVVLSDADPETVDRLVAQRHAFDLAVAFLVSPRQLTLARTLTDAGWLCVTSAPGDPVHSAWLDLGAGLEVTRGRD
ncbi:MAG: hypothetical protein QOI70_1716 [Microbacteriaceae bacterium]|jgi:uncharacterized protein (DUF58 family)|nr:hypothetical protein [Microbacteriaceae bacterium]